MVESQGYFHLFLVAQRLEPESHGGSHDQSFKTTGHMFVGVLTLYQSCAKSLSHTATTTHLIEIKLCEWVEGCIQTMFALPLYYDWLWITR